MKNNDVTGFDWYMKEDSITNENGDTHEVMGYTVSALFADGSKEVIGTHADKFKTVMGMIYGWAGRAGMSDEDVESLLNKPYDLPPGHGYEVEVDETW